MLITLPSPVVFKRDANLTVSPKMRYRGILMPTDWTPAITGPVFIPKIDNSNSINLIISKPALSFNLS